MGGKRCSRGWNPQARGQRPEVISKKRQKKKEPLEQGGGKVNFTSGRSGNKVGLVLVKFKRKNSPGEEIAHCSKEPMPCSRLFLGEGGEGWRAP